MMIFDLVLILLVLATVGTLVAVMALLLLGQTCDLSPVGRAAFAAEYGANSMLPQRYRSASHSRLYRSLIFPGTQKKPSWQWNIRLGYLLVYRSFGMKPAFFISERWSDYMVETRARKEGTEYASGNLLHLYTIACKQKSNRCAAWPG